MHLHTLVPTLQSKLLPREAGIYTLPRETCTAHEHAQKNDDVITLEVVNRQESAMLLLWIYMAALAAAQTVSFMKVKRSIDFTMNVYS